VKPLRLVPEVEAAPLDAAPAQRPLRILTVAPTPARPAARVPVGPLEIVALGDGQCIIVGDVTPGRRRELERLACEALLERDAANVSTCTTPEKVRLAMLARLRDFGRRPGSSPLCLAGRLYLEHGEQARAELARLAIDGATWSKADGYLDRAGLPPHDALPGLG